jgi:RNA polymerase sigma factor (TIGR02999 family)
VPAPPAHDVTQLLVAWSEGNKAAFEQLVPLVYAELRQVAHGRMRDERPDHVLQTTALINEAYLRLVDINRVRWESRAHFFAISARIMRRILVDAARERDARKRGGEISHVVFDEALMPAPERDADLVALDAALEALARADPRKSEVVELRYFGGLSVEETAEVLGVSVETVARDWRLAKLRLLRELEQGKPERPDRARADCGGDGRP